MASDSWHSSRAVRNFPVADHPLGNSSLAVYNGGQLFRPIST